METRPGPHTQGERYDLIDALRGFALLGVCLANLSPLSLYEFLGPDAQAWLRRFQYGPVEWVWRWATYGERPAAKA